MNSNQEHIPAPCGHAPRLTTHTNPGWHGIVVEERESGAWMHCENPVSVKQ